MASVNMQSQSAPTTHTQALQAKHAGLEARLHEEMSRPAPDELLVREIKLRKLRIKEELAAS